jgi:hypothetical protein
MTMNTLPKCFVCNHITDLIRDKAFRFIFHLAYSGGKCLIHMVFMDCRDLCYSRRHERSQRR